MAAAFEKRHLHVANICVVSVYLGKGMCFLSVVFEVIYQKRVRVFHQGFQTPRNR